MIFNNDSVSEIYNNKFKIPKRRSIKLVSQKRSINKNLTINYGNCDETPKKKYLERSFGFHEKPKIRGLESNLNSLPKISHIRK